MHDADVGPQRIERHVADVVAVDGDAAAGHVVEARQQVEHGALAAARRPEQRDRLPGPRRRC